MIQGPYEASRCSWLVRFPTRDKQPFQPRHCNQTYIKQLFLLSKRIIAFGEAKMNVFNASLMKGYQWYDESCNCSWIDEWNYIQERKKKKIDFEYLIKIVEFKMIEFYSKDLNASQWGCREALSYSWQPVFEEGLAIYLSTREGAKGSDTNLKMKLQKSY